MRPNTKAIAINAHIAISSNSSHIFECSFCVRPPACYAKVTKSFSQPARLGIRHQLAVHTTVVWQKRGSVSLSESPTSFQSEGDGRNDKQVHRRNAIRMVAQERLPALGRWSSPARHILGDASLPNVDAEPRQFAVDTRCTPQRIGDTLADI